MSIGDVFHVGQRVDIPRFGLHGKITELTEKGTTVEVIGGQCDGQTHYFGGDFAERELQPTKGFQ